MTNSKYSLGLSSFSLLRDESIVCAREYIENKDWEALLDRIVEKNLLQRTHASTSRVAGREVVKRLKKGEEWELEYLADTDAMGDISFICLLLISRQYRLLRDLIIDLIIYKKEGGSTLLESYEIDAWYTSLADTHPEIEEMKPGSYTRLCGNTKLILTEGGILEKSGEDRFRITPPSISPVLSSMYETRGRSDDLRLLLKTDAQIRAIMEKR